MVSSFGFWWLTSLWNGNFMLGIAMWEIFHDVQYLAIVWIFNRNRVEKDASIAGFTRFIFRKSYALKGLYLGLIFAYGSLSLVPELLGSGLSQKIMEGFLLASGALHFYFDGFIWKVRERETRKSLGLQVDKSQFLRAQGMPPGLRHALYWTLFVISVLWLGSMQLHHVRPIIARFESILRIAPGSVKLHNNLGNEYLAASRIQEAERHFLKAVSIGQASSQPYSSLGKIYMGQGNPEQAIQYIQKAIAIDDGYGELYHNLGAAFKQAGKIKEALVALYHAESLRPGDASILATIGSAYQASGDHDNSIRYFQKAKDANKNISFSKYFDQLLFEANGVRRLDKLDKLIKKDPSNITLYIIRADDLTKMGLLEQALSELNRGLKFNPLSSELYRRRSVISRKMGRIPESERDIYKADSLAGSPTP